MSDTNGSTLTPKQARFVDEYFVDMSATAAAIRAGYSAKTAHSAGPRLLANVGIAAALSEKAKGLTSSADLTVQMVIDGLLTEATRDGEGSSHSARVAAWSHLAKYLKMFADHDDLVHKVLIYRSIEELDAA